MALRLSARIPPKGRQVIPTTAHRRHFLDTSAKILSLTLDATEAAGLPDAALSMTLKDDQQDIDLMRLAAPGIRWLRDTLSRHKCGPSHDGDSTCPLLYMAWVIQGCQSADETYHEAMARNGVTVNGVRVEEA